MTNNHGEMDHEEFPDRPIDWVTVALVAILIAFCIAGAVIATQLP